YDLARRTPRTPVARLSNPSSLACGGVFGWAVAISGTRMAVGTCENNGDIGPNKPGSVYVYDLASATPASPVLGLNSSVRGDYFSYSLALSGSRLVVGAPRHDTGASTAGVAYVYDLASSNPTGAVVTLNNPDPAEGDNFGNSVAISGTRVVVGAYNDSTVKAGAGSAYVYDLASGSPTMPLVTLNNPNAGLYDQFGNSVAISDTHVLVGAHLDDTGAEDAGIAYLYDLGSATPGVPVATFHNPNPAPNGNFG